MQPIKPTLSVVIPALNEEVNIEAAVAETVEVIAGRFADYELLLFNDGSSDQTGVIMDRLASMNPRIRVTHNPRSRNLGGVFKQGVALARYDYLLMVPGDNENPGTALVAPIEAIGKADIVIPYTTNQHVRPFGRRIASRAYVGLLNLLFCLHLKYYNGTVIHRTAKLRAITINTDSFSYQSEALIKLLRAGASYVEVGIEIQPRIARKSRAFRWCNIRDVGKAIGNLLHDIYFPSQQTKTPNTHG